MSKLESIVPPLELCKLIPAGEFEDSVLVWTAHGVRSVEELSRLEFCKNLPIRKLTFPAPTLAEIWNELPTVWNNRFLVMLDVTNRGKGHQIGYARLIDGVLDSDGDFCTQDLNPAIAALWLWFRVKGASC